MKTYYMHIQTHYVKQIPISLLLQHTVNIGVTTKCEKVKIIACSCGRETGKNNEPAKEKSK